MRQKGVLLGLVEAVNLVDEDDGPGAEVARFFGIGHDLLDFLDPGQHGRKLDELRLGAMGDDLRQRGFAHARRTPKKNRARIVALDLHAQWLAGAEDVFLAGELVQIARPHAVGQRPRPVDRLLRVRNGSKKTHSS